MAVSTIALLLCAAGFFISESFSNHETLDRDTVGRLIEHVIDEINENVERVFRQVLDSGLPDVEERIAVLLPYKTKARQHLSTLETVMNHFIELENVNDFNVTECRKYFYDYKETINDNVIARMDSVPHIVFNTSLSLIAELTRTSNQQKNKLIDLKVRANTCVTDECEDISASAENIYTNFLPATVEAQDFYLGMINGSSTIEEMHKHTDWDKRFNEGVEALRKIYECVHYRNVTSL